MATVSKGRTFVSGETVTPAKLNELVDNATVTAIQTADISDSQITTAKIADANVTTAKIADANVTAAKISNNAVETANINNAAVTAAKLDGAQTGSAPIYGCRAWVLFDGTKDSTGAASTANTNRLILSSGNVSSVLRNGTGDYTVNFTTALADANFCALDRATTQITFAGSVKTSSSYRLSTGYVSSTLGGATNQDASMVNVAIFR